MDFPLNAEVHCTDGRCGRSTHVILNPTSEQITHIVVRERQPSRVERLVPVMLVAKTAAEVMVLNCTREEFARLEPFVQTEFVYGDLPHHATDPSLTLLWPYVVPAKRVVDEKVRPIPPGELAVRRGARVRATDGWIGRVDAFCVDPESGYITHLVLQEGNLWKDRLVTIPVTQIDRMEEKVVYLKVDKAAVRALQPVPVERQW